MLIGFIFLVSWLVVALAGSLFVIGFLIKHHKPMIAFGGGPEYTATWLLALVAALGSSLLLAGIFWPV